MTSDQIHIEYCKASIDAAKTALQKLREIPKGFDRSISGAFTELIYRSEIKHWEDVLFRHQNNEND